MKKYYFEARLEAIKWLNSSREFNAGVAILKKSGYKPVVVSKLQQWGDKPYAREKLIYEIRQMIQMWANPTSPIYVNVDLDEEVNETSESATSAAASIEISEEPSAEETSEYPPVIRKVVYKTSELFKERDKLQKELVEKGESNQANVIKERKQLASKIHTLSERITKLMDVRYEYQRNGNIPSDDELDSLFSSEEEDDEDDNEDNSSISESEDGLEGLSIEQLKNLLKNEQTKYTRAKCQLLYQQYTIPKDKKENPMPDCPKRVKYERKIQRLEAKIEKIRYRIAELS